MKGWKTIIKKSFFSPVWIIVLLVIISTTALVTVFLKGWENTPTAYLIYVISFYSLVVTCIACFRIFPKYYRKIKQKIYGNKFGNRYMTDVAFKTHISLYRSLTINLLYVTANAFWAIWYRTVWFAVFALYYSILAVMRFLLIRYVKQNEIGKDYLAEWKRSRLCAVILLMINLVLSGVVLMILYQDRGFEYSGILIYVMALYTFYITISAVVNIVRYRKYNSPVMSTAKVINFAAALISTLSLETAMLSQFGTENEAGFQRIMTMATGAGISVIIVTMSIYMIVQKNNEELR